MENIKSNWVQCCYKLAALEVEIFDGVEHKYYAYNLKSMDSVVLVLKHLLEKTSNSNYKYFVRKTLTNFVQNRIKHKNLFEKL